MDRLSHRRSIAENCRRATSLPPNRRTTGATAACAVSRDAVRCPICFDLLCVPVTLSCGHNFDRGCLLTAWTHETDATCPLCRRRAATDDLHVNLLLQQLIAAQFPLETAALLRDVAKCHAHIATTVAPRAAEHHRRPWHTAASIIYVWLASVTEPPGFVLAVLLLMSLLAIALTPQQMLSNASTLPTLFEGLDHILNAFLLLVREIAARLDAIDLQTWPCVQVFAFLV